MKKEMAQRGDVNYDEDGYEGKKREDREKEKPE